MRTGRSWRWAVPAVVVVGIGAGLGINGALSANAAPALPTKSASQLLVSLQRAEPRPFSGTVVERANLGLPDLPTLGTGATTDPMTLLSGSHTMRVWYGGPDKARTALLGNLGESDIIRDGRTVWMWNSDKNTATRYTLPADSAERQRMAPPTPLTPGEAADRMLAAVSPTTRVSVDGTTRIAGRSAYELVVRPKDTRSTVSSIRVALDSETYAPLRLQVYAKGKFDPALQVGFTHVSFSRPGDEQFRFNPPDGAKVTTGRLGSGWQAKQGSEMPSTVGTGWTQVLVVPNVRTGDLAKGSGELGGMLTKLPRVSGSWGSGRLFSSALVNGLLTDDGRLIVGAVSPQLLYAAAAHR